jgi:hypothetical protein
MDHDLVPALKAAEELEPAVEAFADATGLLAPVREIALWATDLIRYRRAPHQARLLMSAAEKVKQSGLPPTAVADKLLRAALEDGAMEDDPDMQDRWSNLLANAATDDSASVRASFARMLSDLEPREAATLEWMDATGKQNERHARSIFFSIGQCRETTGIGLGGIDNLIRLGLARFAVNPHWDRLGQIWQTEGEIEITSLGVELVEACRPPQPLRPD